MMFWWRKQPELRDELDSHVQMAAQDRIDRGEDPSQSRQRARRELGNEALIRETTRDQWGWRWLGTLLQDLRYASRMLRKSPGFTAVAILTLALGIGANIALFAVMKAVLHPRLPYPHAERITDIYNRNLKIPGDYAELVSIPLWKDWRSQNHSFEDVAAYTFSQYLNLTGAGEAGRTRGARVTANIFSVLGLRPFLGREFREDEAAPGRDHVAILSYRFWTDRLDGRPDVVGQSLYFDREKYVVVGVLPQNFELGALSDHEDVLMPLDLAGPDSARRDLRSVIAIGRLKPAVSIAGAEADLSRLTEQVAKAYPATDTGWDANVVSLHEDLVPFGSSRFAIFLSLAAMVLLLACLNIAVLSSVQAETRKQEFVIRTVLGATRCRLLHQSLSESALLSALGTTAAFVLAIWGTQVFIRYTPADFINGIRFAPLDLPIVAAAWGMCICTIFLIGVFPALANFRTGASRWLGRASPRIARGHGSHGLLVAAEIAVGVALIVGAGVLARSLHAISTIDAGFDPHNVVSARLTLDPVAYSSGDERVLFSKRFVSELQARHGVFATAGSGLPLSDTGWLDNTVSIPGKDADNTALGERRTCFSVFTYPGYFAVLRTPILAGRDFTENESDPVVIVNEAFARTFLPGQTPVGKLVSFSPNVNTTYNGVSTSIRRVIGVVRDFRDNALRYNAPTFPTAFFPYAQHPTASLAIIVRSSHPDATVALLREEAARLDPSEPLYSVQSMSDEYQRAFGAWEFQTWFGALAAVVAMLLSAIGVFGVVSHSVRQRTREIGIRIALGGQPSNIVPAMMKRVAPAILAGVASGLLAAFALTRHLSSLLFHVAAFDPASFVIGAVVLAAIAVLACYIPARRALRVDPMVALRYE